MWDILNHVSVQSSCLMGCEEAVVGRRWPLRVDVNVWDDVIWKSIYVGGSNKQRSVSYSSCLAFQISHSVVSAVYLPLCWTEVGCVLW